MWQQYFHYLRQHYCAIWNTLRAKWNGVRGGRKKSGKHT